MKAITTAAAKIAKQVFRAAKTHSPAVLTGVGIASMITAIPLTVRGVRKFDALLEETGVEWKELGTGMKFKIVGKSFWPAFTVTAIGGASVIGGQATMARRFEAVEGLLIASNEKVETYKKAIQNNLSKNKANAVEDAVVDEQIKSSIASKSTETIVVDGGVHFIDMYTGDRFVSTFEEVKAAFVDFGYDMMDSDGRASLNQLRYHLGLDECTVGDIVQFCYDHYGHKLEPDFERRPPREINGVVYIPLYYNYDPDLIGEI